MAHKLLQDENGILYIAKEIEELTVEAAQSLCTHLESDIALVKSFLAKELNPQPLPPADQASDQPQTQPTDQLQVATPADPSAQPADPNATVAAPAAPAESNQPADPNAQPAPAAPVEQTAPAADPNAQPQVHPEMPPLQ